MEDPNITTKVMHSKSKPAWNIINAGLGTKYKIARVPYLVIEGNEAQSLVEKNEALRHANFINYCFNKSGDIVTSKQLREALDDLTSSSETDLCEHNNTYFEQVKCNICDDCGNIIETDV